MSNTHDDVYKITNPVTMTAGILGILFGFVMLAALILYTDDWFARFEIGGAVLVFCFFALVMFVSFIVGGMMVKGATNTYPLEPQQPHEYGDIVPIDVNLRRISRDQRRGQ